MKINVNGSVQDVGSVFRYLIYKYKHDSNVKFLYENNFELLVLKCTGCTSDQYEPYSDSSEDTPTEYSVTSVELAEVEGTVEGTTLTAETDEYTQDSIFAFNDKWYKITGEATASEDQFTYTVEEINATEVEISDSKFSSTEEFSVGDYVTDGTDLYQVAA